MAQAVIMMMKQLCHKKVGLRHDGEPAMVELASRIQTAGKQHGLDIVLQKVPEYSHQSNGSAEKANDLVQKQVRTLRFDLEERAGLTLLPTSAVWPWLVRHAAWSLARYAVKANGRTAFQDAFATDYRGEICPFGEVVMAKRNVSDSGAIQGGGRLMKADTPWDKAVWLGRSDGTDEHLVGDETGVYKTRSVRRLLPDKEMTKEMIFKMQGVPWDLKENASVKPKVARKKTDMVPVALGRAPGTPGTPRGAPGTPQEQRRARR
jgi:hypothetical protein